MQNALMSKFIQKIPPNGYAEVPPRRYHSRTRQDQRRRQGAAAGFRRHRDCTQQHGDGREHHGSQGQFRPGRGAHFPHTRARDRPHRRGAYRTSTPRQVVLSQGSEKAKPPACASANRLPASFMRPANSAAPFRCEATLERELQARGFRAVAGVDEVGRGALFGPVVAGAVILSPDRPVRGLNDSKQLEPEEREILAERIRERAVAWSIGVRHRCRHHRRRSTSIRLRAWRCFWPYRSA